MTALQSENEAAGGEQFLLVEEITHRFLNEYATAIATIEREVARTVESGASRAYPYREAASRAGRRAPAQRSGTAFCTT